MLVKMGVDITLLERPIRRVLSVVDDVFKEITGQEAVLTSTFEGDHKPSSLHYANLAVDFRIRHVDMATRDDLRLAVKKRLRDVFGALKYDVLFSAGDTCLHIEYDPK